MWENLTLKRVIAMVRLSLFITSCWPLPKNEIKFKVICIEIYQYLCVILTFGLTIGLVNAIRNHLDDPIIIAKSIVFICPSLHIICSIAYSKVNFYRLQFVTFEMENFCDLLKPHEKIVVQKYIDKCVHFYGGSIVWFYLCAIIVILAPVTMDQPFPTTAEYPFDIYHQPMRFIIFIHQAAVAMQGAAHMCMNILIVLLLWFTSARFELLAEKLQRVTNIYDLIKCIQEHQQLLKYAEEVIVSARPFALLSICCTSAAVIIMSVVFIINQPLPMKIQCTMLVLSGMSEVFMYTWPAEHLIYISGEVGEAIFNMDWYEQSVQLQKNLQMIIMRSQKPVVITIPCMPSLSLNYYASYLSTIFSYFTTLRIIIQTDQDVQ